MTSESPEKSLQETEVKLPLSVALRRLAEIHSLLEEGHSVDEVLDQILPIAMDNIAAAVDRYGAAFRIATGGTLSTEKKTAGGLLATAYQDVEDAKARVARQVAIVERMKERLKFFLESGPLKELAGDSGRFVLQMSSQGGIEYEMPFAKAVSITNVLSDETIELFSIPNRYLTRAEVWSLNGDKVRDDLEAGVVIPWAKLKPREKYIRFYEKKARL